MAAPLGHAFEVGAVNLRSATALNGEVAEATEAFAKFGKNPLVIAGIEDATHTLGLANPLFAGLAPAQTTCNYVTLTFRNLASLLSQSIGVGTLARAAPVLAPTGPNNEGFPSSAYANGPSTEPPTVGSAGPGPDNNHLHVNPYPNVAGPGQSKECEAGNEPYKIGEAVIGNVPGNVGTKTEETERKNNLFGVEYPASTLEALGLKGSKGAKK